MIEQKRVIITGANGGLGSELVNQYLSHGWSVIAVDKEFSVKSSKLIQLVCDFTDQQQISSLLGIIKQYGPIHTLILNAAHYSLEPTESIAPQHLTTAWMVNVLAPFQILQACLKLSLQHCLVMGTDQIFTPFAYNMSYCMTKAALMQMVRSATVEYKHLHILGICPITLTDTPMTSKAASLLAELESKSKEQILQMFADEAPDGKSLDPDKLAQWLYNLELNQTYQSGDIIYVDSQLVTSH